MGTRRGRFGIVPTRALHDRRIGAAAVVVLTELSAFADENGECWPAHETIARNLGLDRTTVARHLRSLEKCGYIEVTRRSIPGRGQTSNYYRLRYDLPRLAPDEDRRANPQPVCSDDTPAPEAVDNPGVQEAHTPTDQGVQPPHTDPVCDERAGGSAEAARGPRAVTAHELDQRTRPMEQDQPPASRDELLVEAEDAVVGAWESITPKPMAGKAKLRAMARAMLAAGWSPVELAAARPNAWTMSGLEYVLRKAMNERATIAPVDAVRPVIPSSCLQCAGSGWVLPPDGTDAVPCTCRAGGTAVTS